MDLYCQKIQQLKIQAMPAHIGNKTSSGIDNQPLEILQVTSKNNLTSAHQISFNTEDTLSQAPLKDRLLSNVCRWSPVAN